MPGGRGKRGAQTSAYYNNTEATPGAERRSLPITPTRSLETLERVEKKEVSPKTRQNTATSPKAAASSPSSQGTAQRAQHSLKDSVKKQQRPKRCCRTAGAKQIPLNRRSKGLQPTGSSIQASRGLPVSRKSRTRRGHRRAETSAAEELRPPLHAAHRVTLVSPSLTLAMDRQ